MSKFLVRRLTLNSSGSDVSKLLVGKHLYNIYVDIELDSGSGVAPSSVKAILGEKYDLPQPTPAQGYRFVGWYTAPDMGGTLVTNDDVVVIGITKLYAAYVERTMNYVDFIQSTGSQYIDTGIVINSSTYQGVRIEVTTTIDTSAQWQVHGIGGSGNCLFVGSTNRQIYYGSGKNNVSQSSYVTVGNKIKYDLDFVNSSYIVTDLTTGTTIVNNTAITKENPTQSYTLWLFGFNKDGGKHSAKLHSARYWMNEELIRDYRPCIDPDGVACLYDEVTATYVYNNGTGTFIPGDPI